MLQLMKTINKAKLLKQRINIMAKTRSIRQKLAEAKKLGMTPAQYSRYLKTGKKSNKVVKKSDP